MLVFLHIKSHICQCICRLQTIPNFQELQPGVCMVRFQFPRSPAYRILFVKTNILLHTFPSQNKSNCLHKTHKICLRLQKAHHSRLVARVLHYIKTYIYTATGFNCFIFIFEPMLFSVLQSIYLKTHVQTLTY